MLLPRFEYLAARTVDEALEMWARAPGAGYMAGGTDLLPQMRLRKRTLARLIDVKKVPELSPIRAREDGSLSIGAAAPLVAIERHPVVRARYPLLAECCRRVGAPPLQNRATMGGNICNASPAADTAVALLALDARIEVRGPAGARSIPATAFFKGPGQTALAPGEMATGFVLPADAAERKGSYLRLSRRRGMDLATVGVLVARSNGKREPRHRIALAAVAPVPLRVPEAEAALDAADTAAAARAAEIARLACSPITDVRGTAEYRREMVAVLLSRGLATLR